MFCRVQNFAHFFMMFFIFKSIFLKKSWQICRFWQEFYIPSPYRVFTNFKQKSLIFWWKFKEKKKILYPIFTKKSQFECSILGYCFVFIFENKTKKFSFFSHFFSIFLSIFFTFFCSKMFKKICINYNNSNKMGTKWRKLCISAIAHKISKNFLGGYFLILNWWSKGEVPTSLQNEL